jgi:predicted dinucleotide-binding enzyme
MQIGIIGTGHIGATLARKLLQAGHEVGVANSRGPESLGELMGELGARACPMTVDEAASFGVLTIVAIPFGAYGEVPSKPLDGRIVVDTMNYYPQRDGVYPDLDSGRVTSSELLQQHLLGARVVKAFNTIYWEVLRDAGRPKGAPGRIAVPLAGDDPEAKRVVMDLIEQIGFDPVDAGDLAAGRRLQPGSPVYTAHLDAATTRARLAA